MLRSERLVFRFGKHSLSVPMEYFFIPYATFIAGEYDFLDVGPDDIVIDAGANIGDFTIKAAATAKLVIAIEPNPESLKLLKSNIESLRNVVVVERALGNRSGYSKLSGHGVTASLSESGETRVQVDTLDHILAEVGVIPTLMKMDIEGAEKFAISQQSCLSSLRKVVIETHSESDWLTCVSVLERAGFNYRMVLRHDIVKRTVKNILKRPISFFTYELSTKFYALRSALSFIINRKTSIPSCDSDAVKLLEAHK